MGDRGSANISRRSFVRAGALASGLAAFALTGCAESQSSPTSANATAPELPSFESPAANHAANTTLTATFATPSSESPSPVSTATPLMLAASWHVFEGLYNLDMHTYRLYPGLAAGDPVAVSDTEYDVTLREGAKFSDGGNVEVADVINAFYANMQSATLGPMLDFIDSVFEKDDRTITFGLKIPFPTLLKQRLALVKIYPSWMTDEQLDERPIGTGPWAFDEIDTEDGGHISFVPNEYYEGLFGASAQSMRFDIASKPSKRIDALIEQKTMVIEDMPHPNADALREAGATVEYLQGFDQAFLLFNCLKEPFNDVHVRQAILYAIDTDRLISKELGGHARAATSFLPKSNPYYHEASTVYAYDQKAAQKLLAEAGVKKLECEILVENTEWVSGLAAQIKDNLAAIGITAKTKIADIDWSELEYAGPAEPLDAAEMELPDENAWMDPENAWSASGSAAQDQSDESAAEASKDAPAFDIVLASGDPSRFGNDPDLLMRWWYGDTTWMWNRTCWAHADRDRYEELQTLFSQAREADEQVRQTIWEKCFDLVAEEAPLYPLLHREIATAYWNPLISGFEPISTCGLCLLGSA